MENISNRIKVIVGILLVLLLLTGMFTLLNDNHEKAQSIKELQQQNTSLKGNESKLSMKYTQLSEQYDALNKEKNGSANEGLLTATNELFKNVYNYDTSKKTDSVVSRKENSKQFANAATLDLLFSKDADKLTPTVTTVSKLESTPEVYRMSSDEKNLTALVLVNYSLSIAGSEKQDGSFMYKMTFDPALKQITAIKNVGEIRIP